VLWLATCENVSRIHCGFDDGRNAHILILFKTLITSRYGIFVVLAKRRGIHSEMMTCSSGSYHWSLSMIRLVHVWYTWAVWLCGGWVPKWLGARSIIAIFRGGNSGSWRLIIICLLVLGVSLLVPSPSSIQCPFDE
jgi:hypothetical protein